MHVGVAEIPKRERVTVPGWWIAAAREAAPAGGPPVTQRRLAMLCETTTTTVQRWEASEAAWVTWLGVLSALGLDRTWRPKPGDEQRIKERQAERRRRRLGDEEPDA